MSGSATATVPNSPRSRGSLSGPRSLEFVDLLGPLTDPETHGGERGILMGALVTTRGQRAESIERVERRVHLDGSGGPEASRSALNAWPRP